MILSLMASFVSCSDKKKAPTKHKKEYVFSKEDTTEVMALVDHFKYNLENKQLRSAVEMLSILKGDSLIPLDPVQQRRQAMALYMTRGISYDVDYLTFNSYKDTEVKINIKLFEKEPDDPKPNTIALFLRPVKFEGKWYLTTKDNITDIANGNTFEEEYVEDEESKE
jgi:hypothetical protein